MSLKVVNAKNEVIFISNDGKLIKKVMNSVRNGVGAIDDIDSSEDSEYSGISLTLSIEDDESEKDDCACHICPEHNSTLFEDMLEWLQERQQENHIADMIVEEEEKKKKKKKRKLVL